MPNYTPVTAKVELKGLCNYPAMKQSNFSHRRLDCLLFLTSKHFKIIFSPLFVTSAMEKNVYKAVIILHQNCWYVHCCPLEFPFSDVQATLMHRSDLTSPMVPESDPQYSELLSGWPWDSSLPMPKLAVAQSHKNGFIKSVSCSPKPLTGQQCSSLCQKTMLGGQHYVSVTRDGP